MTTLNKMLVSLTVGKVDAGVAVLLTEDKRLIEFPSILLPPSISSGSIVDITVSRNHASEAASQKAFLALQSSIHTTYGLNSPSSPILRCRNATQTSVVLEWDPIQLATADLRSLSLYRNGNKAGAIPRPLDMTSTKISGLAIDTEYTFHLVLRTSAGTYASERLKVRTHKMTDLSGITVTPGVLPGPLRQSLAGAVERIGAKLAETVRIDTTHFVCTEGRGREWERASEMNIPVVRPEWVEGCEREGRIVGVRQYYLNADPRLRQVGQGVGAGPAGPPRRTDSLSSAKRGSPVVPTAMSPGGTGGQAESSGRTTAGWTEAPAANPTAARPPTPPTKEAPQPHDPSRTPRLTVSATATASGRTMQESPRSSIPAPLAAEESDAEETEERFRPAQAQGPRELLHSPSIKSRFEVGDEGEQAKAPHGSAAAAAAAKEEDAVAQGGRSRQNSEAGGFSEVEL